LQLAGIDPWWNPAWPTPWQRRFRIDLAHVENGGSLKGLLNMPEGHKMSGEDVGKWARQQQPPVAPAPARTPGNAGLDRYHRPPSSRPSR
jgi:hypothetical protein